MEQSCETVNRSDLIIQIILRSGKFLYVTDQSKEVLESIVGGKDQFVEMQCTDGHRHYVNINHITDVLEVKEVFRR